MAIKILRVAVVAWMFLCIESQTRVINGTDIQSMYKEMIKMKTDIMNLQKERIEHSKIQRRIRAITRRLNTRTKELEDGFQKNKKTSLSIMEDISNLQEQVRSIETPMLDRNVQYVFNNLTKNISMTNSDVRELVLKQKMYETELDILKRQCRSDTRHLQINQIRQSFSEQIDNLRRYFSAEMKQFEKVMINRIKVLEQRVQKTSVNGSEVNFRKEDILKIINITTGLGDYKENPILEKDDDPCKKCSNLCFVKNLGTNLTLCGCPFDIPLDKDNKTCSAKNMLIFANRRALEVFDSDNPTTIISFQSDTEDATALDFIYEENVVYWTDVSLEMVKRKFLNGSNITENIIDTDLFSPDGLACDWISKKIYWVDSGRNRIELSHMDGSDRKVLFTKNLDRPRSIALDPLQGWIFWTDWGKVPKIETGGMHGDSATRKTIVSYNIHWPNGLTVDLTEERIYWVDGKLKFISSCDYDGRKRRVVLSGEKYLGHPFAMTQNDKTIFWTDWQKRSIFSCGKTNCKKKVTKLVGDLYSPMDIKAFRKQPKRKNGHPCLEKNAGCSHLCLISPTSPFYKCGCPTGVKLLNNNTCSQNLDKFLLVLRRKDLRLISMDTQDIIDVVIPNTQIKHGIAVDYDPVDNSVYWTDDEEKSKSKIQRISFNGSGNEIIITEDINHPDGLAVDWIARNIFWTDTGTNKINVAHLDGSARTSVIKDDLDEPRAISLDLNVGYMYWTDWGKIPRIERACLDGSDRRILINTSIGWPNGLVIDFNAKPKLLYWGDAKLDKIEVSTVEGKDRKILVSKGLPHLFGLSLLDNYLYWTDWQKRSVQRVHKATGEEREVMIDMMSDLMGLKAATSALPAESNLCGRLNGGCSHLCLFTANKGPVCACSKDMSLDVDSKTCVAKT